MTFPLATLVFSCLPQFDEGCLTSTSLQAMTAAVRQPQPQIVFEDCFYPVRALHYASHGLEEPQASKLLPKPQGRSLEHWSSCNPPFSTAAVIWQWRSSQMLEMAQSPRILAQFVVEFVFFRRCRLSHRFASVVIPVGFCPPPKPFPVTPAIGGLRKSQDLGEQEVRR